MKKLTIFTIIGFMFAFVLPMAQAQNPQAEDTISSEQLRIEKENPEKDNGDPTKATTDVEISIDEGEKNNSRETEGTAQLDVTVSLTVRGKKIDGHHARVRLLDAKGRHEIQRIEKGENGRYLFTGIPAGKYVVEAYFFGYPKDFKNVTLAKGEQKSILIDSKTEQLARIQVAGKLLDKRTGKGIEGATIHFVGAPKDNVKTYPDGSFATHADRARFHQILAWLVDDKALRDNRIKDKQRFGIRMNNNINEDLAANLQIHIDPEHLSLQQDLRDENGDGIFCDGIGCVVCPAERQQNQQQLSQALQSLQAQLKQLQIEKQKLEHEIHTLEHAKHTEHAEHQAEQAKLKAKDAALKAKEAKDQAEKAKDMAAKAETSAEAQTGEGLITSVFIDNDLALEVLPSIAEQAGISIIPDETVAGLISCKLDEVPFDTALDIILAGTPYIVSKTPDYYWVSSRGINATRFPVSPVPPEHPRAMPSAISRSTQSVEIKKDKNGKYVATTEMKFVAKVKPGRPFVVRNSLGNIILKPSKDGTCDVKAVIRATAKSSAEAQAMVEQVSLHLHSSDEGYYHYLKPVKHNGGQWNNLSVDIHIAVPPGIRPDVKTDLGNIEISNLKENIKAVTDLGSIKAINTTGNIELFTNLGDIEFIAPKNLSAKLQAQTKMGEIESELPLEVRKLDMFKTNAEGTLGTGQTSIKMATNMGKISLKWQSSSQDELKL